MGAGEVKGTKKEGDWYDVRGIVFVDYGRMFKRVPTGFSHLIGSSFGFSDPPVNYDDIRDFYVRFTHCYMDHREDSLRCPGAFLWYLPIRFQRFVPTQLYNH